MQSLLVDVDENVPKEEEAIHNQQGGDFDQL
jgi:hypothetical protein